MVLLQFDSSTDDESRKPESEQTQLLFSTQTTGQCEREMKPVSRLNNSDNSEMLHLIDGRVLYAISAIFKPYNNT